MSTILRGDGSFPFVAIADGDDLLVENVNCTWFGGPSDPGDDGQTASGVNTKNNPGIKGVALPMDGFHHPATNGSPIPKLPWRTKVVVRNLHGGEGSFELIDLGPSKHAASHAAIDLTPPAFEQIGGSLRDGIIKVSYRIIGGATHLPGFAMPSVSLRHSLTRERPESFFEHPGGDNGHGTSKAAAKPPIKQFIQSPNRSSRNGTKIKTIILHCTEGPTAKSAINEFLNPGGRRVSAHYVVDRNGDIYQMVADSEIANHCKGANQDSIGIEHVGLMAQELAGAQTTATVQLIAYLKEQYGVGGDQIFGHDFAPKYTGGGTSCPDHLFGGGHTQQAIVDWLKKNGLA
jgi:hypothetical protein